MSKINGINSAHKATSVILAFPTNGWRSHGRRCCRQGAMAMAKRIFTTVFKDDACDLVLHKQYSP
ncbi:MAG TPA: hypothetical protein VFE58_04790, partial [Tepidisphaeraceae bacterium]|nr:hypothetical protein [Tepidisphaeraceae bacterium]